MNTISLPGPGSDHQESAAPAPARSYKVLTDQKEGRLDPAAGKVATQGLDLPVRELGFRRPGINPFLIGY
jgi:formate dehydrogenase maturation protein FdhE